MGNGPNPDPWIQIRYLTDLDPQNLDPTDPGRIWILAFENGYGPGNKNYPDPDPFTRFFKDKIKKYKI